MRFKFAIIVFVVGLLVLASLRAALAFDFNPNNIISDFDLKDKNSMSVSAIQAFLDKYSSPIRSLTFDTNGVKKTAAEIIYQAAQEYFISPKFILTKIDHEQCLVRGCSYHNDPQKFQRALDWAAGFALCTGCNVNDPKIQKYKGFVNQVDAVASVQNDYIRKADRSNIYAKGQTFTTHDGATITPENQATANLYTYTPYKGGETNIGGNYFFAKLWDKYWGNLLYPDGTIAKDGRGTYWLIEDGAKRRYASSGIFFSSYSDEDAITVSDAVLDGYGEGTVIKFSNYSLVRDETGSVYLLVDGRKRKIENDEVFRLLGFNPEEVVRASSFELGAYKNAVPITGDALYPQGALLQEENTGIMFWVQNGFKYLVYPEVLDINYSGSLLTKASKSELDGYYLGEPKKIADGKLVKSGANGVIYFISRGVLRPILSTEQAIALFGEQKTRGIKTVSENIISLHETGSPIETSAYERNEATPPQVAGERTQSPVAYQALWIATAADNSAVVGKEYKVKATFRNKSGVDWKKGDLEIRAEEMGTSALNSDIVFVGSDYIFNVPLLFDKAGDKTVTFKLYAKDSGNYVKGGLFELKVKVIAPVYTGEIVSSNMRVAVRRVWNQIPVEITIKNTGSKPWTRRKTGLEFLDGSGNESPFYDKSDWVNRRAASVSLQPLKDTIGPGEVSVFKFTLSPLNLAPGVYRYRVRLYMSDKGDVVYVNGREFIEGVLRVDK